MSPTAFDSSASLSELLHARALTTAPRRLLLDLTGGTLAMTAALWFRPKGWVALASAGLCFAVYSVWAFAERHLSADDWLPSGRVRRGMRAVHLAASIVGLVALVLLLFSLLGLTLGTWIS